jgi:hypothetical protein
MFNAFVTPAAGWRPPTRLSAARPPIAVKNTKLKLDWEDAAAEGDWQGAVVSYLRERRRQAVPYWSVINAIVLASAPPDRRELRLTTRQLLAVVKALIRDRRIMRFRRRFLVILDTGDEVIPLKQYRALPCATATGRRGADSTLAR